MAPIFDELHESSLPLISVNFEKPLVIPENIRYSIGDDVLPYLSGRRLSVSKDNAYEQVLPLILKDKDKFYRYMIFTGDVSEINKSTKPSSSILQSARKMQSTETLREFPLKECPFSLEGAVYINQCQSQSNDLFARCRYTIAHSNPANRQMLLPRKCQSHRQYQLH